MLPLNTSAQITAINVSNPGTPGAVTTVSLLCVDAAALIAATTDTAKLAGVRLICYAEGAATASDCTALADIGPAAGGRVFELAFDVDADTSLEWALQWPGNSLLLKTTRGGCLGGIIGPDQDVTAIPFGSLFFGPNDGGLIARPTIAAVGPNTQPSAGVWAFNVTVNGSPADLALADTELAVNIEGTDWTVPLSSSGSGQIELDLSGTGAVSGDDIRWNAYAAPLRLADGGYIAPADAVLS